MNKNFNNIRRIMIVTIAVLTIIAFSFSTALAEGSKEMNANGGSRPVMTSSMIFKVYVNTGEDVLLGSGNNGIAINWQSPAGTDNGSCTVSSATPMGFIANAAEETAGPEPNPGGFDVGDIANPDSSATDCVFDAKETGIYYVTIPAYVTYWDITVRTTASDAGTTITGRVYTNVLDMDMGSWG